MSPRVRDALLLAAVVLAGLVLRLRELPAHRPSPDEGNYMQSARLDSIGREGGPARWVRQDARWAREMVRDFSRAENKTSYPHGYVEQWTMRMAYRAGASCFTSVRLSSAVLGALLAVALYAAARAMRMSSSAALAAAGIGAFAIVFVWYSRTGWGQVGCTFFYVLYVALAWRVLDPEREPSRGELVMLGVGLAATSLLAYGWHEAIVVQVGWMGLFAGLAPLFAPKDIRRGRGLGAALLANPRTWTIALSALPLALLFAALLASPWAQETWFSESLDGAGRPTLERYRLAAKWLLEIVRVQGQISYPVLALALVGAVSTFARRRFLFAFLVANALGSAAMLFLKFNLPHLVRIYLPALALVALLAGEGFAALAGLARRRGAAWVPWAVGAPLAAYLFASSWQTLFAPLDAPLVARVELHQAQGLETRWSSAPLLDVLDRELGPDEPVGIHQSFEMYFRLQDRGLRARMFNPPDGRPWPEELPRFVIAVPASFEGAMNANFEGPHPYERVVVDTVGRFGLYRLRQS